MSRLLVTGCEVDGVPGLDVRVRNGVVTEIAPKLRVEGDLVLDAAGGALLPGLHDHHLHLMAMAAALESVPCGPPAVGDLDGERPAMSLMVASREIHARIMPVRAGVMPFRRSGRIVYRQARRLTAAAVTPPAMATDSVRRYGVEGPKE